MLEFLGVNPRLTSVLCILRLAHSRLNISYRTFVCRDIETELLFFYCKFHDAARAILCNRICTIVTDSKSPELFDCLSNVELMRIFLFGPPVGVGAGKCLGVRRIIAQISPNCPKLNPKKKTTAFHLAHFFKSRHFKHRFCPKFTQASPNFS